MSRRYQATQHKDRGDYEKGGGHESITTHASVCGVAIDAFFGGGAIYWWVWRIYFLLTIYFLV